MIWKYRYFKWSARPHSPTWIWEFSYYYTQNCKLSELEKMYLKNSMLTYKKSEEILKYAD